MTSHEIAGVWFNGANLRRAILYTSSWQSERSHGTAVVTARRGRERRKWRRKWRHQRELTADSLDNNHNGGGNGAPQTGGGSIAGIISSEVTGLAEVMAVAVGAMATVTVAAAMATMSAFAAWQ